MLRLEMPVKIKSLRVHLVADVPGKEDAELDVLVNDPDGDGDPNYAVKWDLPGAFFDSGPKGITGEIPVASFVKPAVEAAIDLAASVAPAPVRPLLLGLKVLVA